MTLSRLLRSSSLFPLFSTLLAPSYTVTDSTAVALRLRCLPSGETATKPNRLLSTEPPSPAEPSAIAGPPTITVARPTAAVPRCRNHVILCCSQKCLHRRQPTIAVPIPHHQTSTPSRVAPCDCRCHSLDRRAFLAVSVTYSRCLLLWSSGLVPFGRFIGCLLSFFCSLCCSTSSFIVLSQPFVSVASCVVWDAFETPGVARRNFSQDTSSCPHPPVRKSFASFSSIAFLTLLLTSPAGKSRHCLWRRGPCVLSVGAGPQVSIGQLASIEPMGTTHICRCLQAAP